MSIKREIEVTRKGLPRPIDVTYGTNILQIELIVTDFGLPEGATAEVYAMGRSNKPVKQSCEITGNKIIFTPEIGLFEEGKNILQLAATHDGKNLFSFYIPVNCQKTMFFENMQDLENDPTFVGMVMKMKQEVGQLSDELVPLHNMNGCIVCNGEEITLKVGEDVETGQTLRFQYKLIDGYTINCTSPESFYIPSFVTGVNVDGYGEDSITIEEGMTTYTFTGCYFVAIRPCSDTGATEEQLAQIEQNKNDISELSQEINNYHRIELASVNKYEVATEHGLITYTDGKFNVSENFRSTRFLPIKPNQQYIIGVASSSDPTLVSFTVSAVVFYDSNKDYISGLSNVNSFTTPENAMYYRCSIYYSGTEANIVQINRCQIEEGNTLTSLRYYKEETGYIAEQYAENIFEISNVELNIQNGYIGADGIFRENASYECVLLEVDEKEVYFINSYSNGASNMAIAYVYDENMKVIPYGTKITVSQENINERFVIPVGAKYMAVTSYKRNNISYLLLRKANLIGSRNLPLKNKNFIALGDSIVAQNISWRDTFIEKTGAKQIMCTAVAGAHLCDYNDTVLNGTDFTEHGNTVCNQVQAILNNPPTENIDFFMVCAGTNDTGFSVEQLKAKDVSQFYSANQPIDIDTVNRTVIDGAMRWIAEKLWSIQPNATIFFATPIQAYQGIRTTWYLHYFSEYMKTVGDYLATPIIPAFSESGIYSAFENNNANGKYLIDGLHPNSDGKVKLGTYYANVVGKYFTY